MYRVLIMLYGLPIGGVEKALLSMLNAVDYEQCSIELLLIKKYGALLKDVPRNIEISELEEKESIILSRVKDSIKWQFIKKNFKFCAIRLWISIKLHLYGVLGRDIDLWKEQEKFISIRDGRYDIAIDYDSFCNRYIISKVDAKKKIYWNHFNYKYFDKHILIDQFYLSQMNYLVAVSKESADILKNYFPALRDSIVAVYNFIDRKKILELSGERLAERELYTSDVLRICSVGRLEDEKGYDLSIEAARMLKDRGLKFIWYVVGEGRRRRYLESQIKRTSLEQEFILLGSRHNPYPYMKHADIYVQTSVFEGYGIALAEARILGKPAVAVNVSGLNEQVRDQIDGLLVKREPAAVADGVEKLSNSELRKYYFKNLKTDLEQEGEGIKVLNNIFGFQCFKGERNDRESD